MAADKQHAHQLLDKLDSCQLAALVHLLNMLTSSLTHSLAMAPVEEEDLTQKQPQLWSAPVRPLPVVRQFHMQWMHLLPN